MIPILWRRLVAVIKHISDLTRKYWYVGLEHLPTLHGGVLRITKECCVTVGGKHPAECTDQQVQPSPLAGGGAGSCRTAVSS